MDKYVLVSMRLKAGLKQWELAWLLNMSQTRLCDLERGRQPITPEIVENIRNAIHEAKSVKGTGSSR